MSQGEGWPVGRKPGALSNMETLVWDQNFQTGIALVDEQHLGLVALFNELSNALFLSQDDHAHAIEETFVRLVDYANHHFEDEERLMHEAGLDPRHVQQHKAAHAAFVQQVHKMWQRHNEIPNLGESFIGFLTSWLGLHILGMDQSMARQIESVARGLSPEQAYENESIRRGEDTHALLKMVSKLYHVLTLQNEELIAANKQLEDRVTQRTVELAQANANLLQANIELETYSRTDCMLQIANRGYFNEQLDGVGRSCRRRRSPLGVLLIDVDFFKRYNDAYGHQAGDIALRAIAQAIKSAMSRAVDLVARYGGEEFVVMLPDTDIAGTRLVGERVVAAVARLELPHKHSEVAPHVTISVGAASAIPVEHDDTSRLLAAADAALYRSKANGRNRATTADWP